MKINVLLVTCLVLMVAISSVIGCFDKGGACSGSKQCCSRYCNNKKCIDWGEGKFDKGKNPCDPSPCLSPQICIIREGKNKPYADCVKN